MTDMLRFDHPKNQSSIIKVIGVGGGGSNAVTHMYKMGIKGVDFVICNTDTQAMESSPVPTKIQLGAKLTGGLGAGSVPSIGRNAALETTEEIRELFSKDTRMVFITAGLGGGTGTGAAPVIAKIAKEMKILTVGIVTIPFAFEGRKRRQFADGGVSQIKQHVDALLIISNDKLRELCGDLRLSEAFKRADNVLTTAAKGIAEIITVTGYINVDFEDVKTVMQNSGVAIMGTGIAGGENRAEKAVEEALSSPLLDNNDIEGAANLLLYILSGSEEVTLDEVTEITNYIQHKTKMTAEVIWGNGFDETLGDQISVTIIATGFDAEHRQQDPNASLTIHPLYEDEGTKPETVVRSVEPEKPPVAPRQNDAFAPFPMRTQESREFHSQVEPEPTEQTQDLILFEVEESPPVNHSKRITTIPSEQTPKNETTVNLSFPSSDRISKLKAMSEKLKSHVPIETNLFELESEPAYKRRNVELNNTIPSSESLVAKYTLSENPDNTPEIRSENTFLNNNVD
jgi:cell division protein FtsZ